jgi:hypothetical protein
MRAISNRRQCVMQTTPKEVNRRRHPVPERIRVPHYEMCGSGQFVVTLSLHSCYVCLTHLVCLTTLSHGQLDGS